MKVLLNNTKTDISDDFQKAKEYFARHNFSIEWDFRQSNITKYKVEEQNFGSSGNRFVLTGHEKQIVIDKNEIVVFVFNGNEFPLNRMPTSKCQISGYGVLITLMTYKEGDVIGETYSHILHEMMHALNQQLRLKGIILEDTMDIMFRRGQWLRYWKNDAPDAPDSNFGEAWKILTPYLNSINGTYKYFKPHEIVGLKPELVRKLDEARGLAGIPFVINSGFRTETHNAEVGGMGDSSHKKGLAVDLRARNTNEHFLITKALLDVGFKRISRKYPTHVHCDLDSAKPQNILF